MVHALLTWTRRVWRALSAPGLRAAADDLKLAEAVLRRIYDDARQSCWDDDQRMLIWSILVPTTIHLTPEQAAFATRMMDPADAMARIAQVEEQPPPPRPPRERLADAVALLASSIYFAETLELMQAAGHDWDALRPLLDEEVRRAGAHGP